MIVHLPVVDPGAAHGSNAGDTTGWLARDVSILEGSQPSGTPSGCGRLFAHIPVVSLADSLNHRLMDWQASGLQGKRDRQYNGLSKRISKCNLGT
jgi:hypothetical protein